MWSSSSYLTSSLFALCSLVLSPPLFSSSDLPAIRMRDGYSIVLARLRQGGKAAKLEDRRSGERAR